MPSALIRSRTSVMPFGNLLFEGRQAPTESHHTSPTSVYQPESMQKHSTPARAAALMSGSNRSVVGSPIKVFM